MLSSSKRARAGLTFYLLLGASLQGAFAHAATNYKDLPVIVHTNPYAYVMTLSGGPAWSNGGNSQTITLQSDVEKMYTANHNNPSAFEAELFFGLQRTINNRFRGQLGLAFARSHNLKLSGNIWDDANPNLNNYTYAYKIQHNHIALKGKVLTDIAYSLSPYISASIGEAANRAHGFNITSSNPAAVPAPAFSAHSENSFTYTLGIGIQKAFTENWQAGIGYEFADWGKNNLGAASGQTIGHGISLNHLYNQQLQFSLSYIA